MTEDLLAAVAIVRAYNARDVDALDALHDPTDEAANTRLVTAFALLVRVLAAEVAALHPQRCAGDVLDAITHKVVSRDTP